MNNEKYMDKDATVRFSQHVDTILENRHEWLSFNKSWNTVDATAQEDKFETRCNKEKIRKCNLTINDYYKSKATTIISLSQL